MKLIHYLLLTVIVTAIYSILFATQINAKQNDSNVLLAKVYQPGTKVQQYLVSEKFDGVRAVWDGSTFHTRTEHAIAAPAWFTKDLPKTPLDGELWLGHGKFEALSGAVRKDVPVDEE